jgi:ABC-type transport system involved in multi-copper enzyme maturation permease subunit
VTRALIWKEFREQGTVLAALIVLGAAVLVTAAVLLDPADPGRATELRALTAAGRLGLLMLTVTAGMVVGGTLFAGEREAGTFAILDMLPGSRWRVWWRKVAAGAAMVAVTAGVFLAVAAAGGLIDRRTGVTGWLLLGGSVAFGAYGWGVLGSVLARTSLSACGVGLVLALLTGVLVYPVVGVGLAVARRELGLWQYIGSEYSAWELAYLVVGYTLVAIPVPIAAWLFTAPDRSRKLAEIDVRLPGVRGVVGAGLRSVSRVRWGAGFRRLLWLTVRQTWMTALALAGAAAVAGCALVPEESVPLAAWPVLGLVAGVLAGVVGLADEQAGGAFRFWGERRMPIGRLWTAKVAVGLALTLLMVVALLVPSVVAAAVRGDHGPRRPLVAVVLRSGVLGEPGFPVLTYLAAWPLYGFAFGHLAALLFRKAVVAAAVGIMVGGTFAALWLPSLLAGGVHGWQVFAPPVLALGVARLLTWPWATDRLGTRAPLTRLAAGAAAVLAVTAAGIGYRVVEVREVPDAEDDVAFARQLPTYDEKQPGRDLRRAVALYAEAERSARGAPARPPGGEGSAVLQGPSRDTTYLARLPAVLESGWPADRPDIDRWMSQVVQGGWVEVVEPLAARPAGVLEDPAELAPDTPLRHLDGMRAMSLVYLARALQLHAGGDPAAVPKAVAVWLAVVRTTRNDALMPPTLESRWMEFQVYQVLDRWLERLDGRPELLRAALTAILDHDRLDPYDPQAVQLAHQVVARNGVLAPSRWLPNYLDEFRQGYRDRSGMPSPAADTETNLVGFAWAVPWEKKRLRRAVGLGNRPGRTQERQAVMRGIPGGSILLVTDSTGDPAYQPRFEDGHKLVLAARRATALKLAARLYESDKGSLPASLDALVPKYLPVVPADPFDGKPFRYRLSQGEKIERFRARSQPPDLVQQMALAIRDMGQFNALAGVGSGLMCWPLEPGWLGNDPPPGLFPEPLSKARITAVAGAVGGAVFWPQFTEWGIREPEPAEAGAPGAGVPLVLGAVGGIPWNPRWNQERMAVGPVSEEVTIPAGQGILWSVGPDGVDSLGAVAIDPRSASQQPHGDLVYLIPRPSPATPQEERK